ncbi:hypothetical protein RSOLAG22IIIB_03285 [Rhizoctonia solani]|uniref:Uncharacterized protein n=1 Tax=Rhizoctonia solani TaxID=456999 RepID=A0A0K6FPG0_9AGAM|nr:hypothetical protein RSOLAG22IIIB_03285 [Rhizoctonia solani]
MFKTLPTEVILQIIQECIWYLRKCERTFQLELAKGKFHAGIANANKQYHAIYMLEWCRALTLLKVEDWKFAVNHGFAPYVRALTLDEGALPSHTAVKHLDFSGYEFIHTLTLNCHKDVGRSASLSMKEQWSYKKIIPNLPRNLKSLIVLNAHGPDLQVIQKATKQCKALESLTLGRCTKYNRPHCCEFWQNFPNDHDSYFSGKGVDGYANALGTELQGLPHLKSIFVNVYLTDTKYLNETNSTAAPSVQIPQSPTPVTTDIVTVTSKRSSNGQTPAPIQGPPNSGAGQPEPREVKSKDQKDTEEAEQTAADILFNCHPALQTVGFVSYWSEKHLGWSVRERKGENTHESSGYKEAMDGIFNVEISRSL